MVECGLRVASEASGWVVEVNAHIVYPDRTYALKCISRNSKGGRVCRTIPWSISGMMKNQEVSDGATIQITPAIPAVTKVINNNNNNDKGANNGAATPTMNLTAQLITGKQILRLFLLI